MPTECVDVLIGGGGLPHELFTDLRELATASL
jgi:hypothetical protein